MFSDVWRANILTFSWAADLVQTNGDLDLAAGDDKADDVAVIEPANNQAAGGGTLAGRKIPPIVSHWNLAEYLPASVRQVFLVRTTYGL